MAGFVERGASSSMEPLTGKELYFANTGNSVWVVPVKEVNGALQFGAARARHQQLVYARSFLPNQPGWEEDASLSSLSTGK